MPRSLSSNLWITIACASKGQGSLDLNRCHQKHQVWNICAWTPFASVFRSRHSIKNQWLNTKIFEKRFCESLTSAGPDTLFISPFVGNCQARLCKENMRSLISPSVIIGSLDHWSSDADWHHQAEGKEKWQTDGGCVAVVVPSWSWAWIKLWRNKRWLLTDFRLHWYNYCI